jgi:hypothetical protein
MVRYIREQCEKQYVVRYLHSDIICTDFSLTKYMCKVTGYEIWYVTD